jgi:hypothetical protein
MKKLQITIQGNDLIMSKGLILPRNNALVIPRNVTIINKNTKKYLGGNNNEKTTN